jgi:NAD(P)-dependent dehydrogenase (short-subunit alcohol dehydrogenase family)
MNVKVLGYLRTIREVAPHMEAQGGGRIINWSAPLMVDSFRPRF